MNSCWQIVNTDQLMLLARRILLSQNALVVKCKASLFFHWKLIRYTITSTALRFTENARACWFVLFHDAYDCNFKKDDRTYYQFYANPLRLKSYYSYFCVILASYQSSILYKSCPLISMGFSQATWFTP